MALRKRPYIGMLRTGDGGHAPIAFTSPSTPTAESHPEYAYVIGPWRSLKDAQHWARDPFRGEMLNSMQYRRPSARTHIEDEDTVTEL